MERKNFQAGTTQTTYTSPFPFAQEAGKSYLQELAEQQKKPLVPTTVERAEGYAPGVAAQGALTQAAQQQAATQAGLGQLTFDPTTGAVATAPAGAGVAGYQPYLDVAGERGAAGISALGTIPGQQITAAQTAAGLAQPLLGGAATDIGTAATTLGGVPGYTTAAGAGLGAAGTELTAAGTTLGGAAPYQTQAAGLTGPLTGQQLTDYMSPYQQAVQEATLTEFDVQAGRSRTQLGAPSVAGVFGGGRHGIAEAEYTSASDRNRAALQAQMEQQGFQYAQQARQQDYLNRLGLGQAAQQLGLGQAGLAGQRAGLAGQQLGLGQAVSGLAAQQAGLGGQRAALAAAQQGLAGTQLGIGTAQQQLGAGQLGAGQYYAGLAQLQPGLAGITQQMLGGAGQQDLAYRQAVEDAARQAEQMRQMEPLERLARLGQGIAGIRGMGQVQTMTGIPAAGPSPLGQAMTAGIGAYGLGRLFGLG